MIVIYPMLISESISPNVLPGLTKAVEKYILLYNTDEVLRLAQSGIKGAMSTGSKIVIGAVGAGLAAGAAALAAKHAPGAASSTSKHLSNLASKYFKSNESFDGYPSGTKMQNKPDDKGKEKVDIKINTSGGGGAKPDLQLPRSESVSLEPTWLQITTAQKGLQILGVKVVPFTVKTGGASMSDLIANDTQLKFLSYLSTKYGRAISRVFFRLMRNIRIPMIKDKALTGDPKKDILFAQTQYGKNLFVCLNQLDIENSEFLNSPAGVQKLHKLGWASIIILDDVNKRATFCMKEFGGVCSVVPYSFMYSSLGKEHSKVYEDLEDLKKSSGPFFNMRTNRKRAFSESKMTTVDKYLELIQK